MYEGSNIDSKVWLEWEKAKDKAQAASDILSGYTPGTWEDLFDELLESNAIELAWETLRNNATNTPLCPTCIKLSSSVDEKTVKDAVDFWHNMAMVGKHLFT